ncbi:MAG TPA: ribonuclease E activity regulator RraA [Salinisphaeraceae bacterium]|nr:ribonuclease E activity regulator RraA [Salinisphaeraceae bacterium]
MATSTADLCDKYADSVQIADSIFTDFGGALDFFGPISTIKCFEDNSQVRKALETPGQGRVLVIDGGASDRCALVGDRMAHLAIDNDWAGLIIYGCVRDAAELADMPIAIKALNTNPRRSEKRDSGEQDVAVHFAGARFIPGTWVYGDLDGIIVADNELAL